jgi:DNA-binding GntR family transcriptional regulator
MADVASKTGIIDITNINEKVYELIKARIIRRDYPPGHQISIRKLQDELGVSNSPIINALFRLSGEGLVEITSRKGTYVKDITERDIYEIEELRIILECGAVDTVARKITDEQVDLLERRYAETLIPERSFDYTTFMEKDSLFHLEIIKLANNQRLIETYKRLNAHIQIARFEFAKQRKKPLPWTHRDHLGIIDALKQRDPEKAKQAIVSHRVKARDAFLGKGKINE